MRLMRTLVFVVGVVTLGTLRPVQSSEPQSWIEARCAAYRGGFCRIPFQVALTSAQELGSKQTKLFLRGFLIKENGGFALYADKQAAQLGWRSNSLLVTAGDVKEIQDSLTRWNQCFVEVQGHLILKASDTDEYWAELAAEQPVFVTGVRGEKLKR